MGNTSSLTVEALDDNQALMWFADNWPILLSLAVHSTEQEDLESVSDFLDAMEQPAALLGNLDDWVRFNQASRTLAIRLGDTWLANRCLYQIGQALHLKEDYAAAAEILRTALDVSVDQDDRATEVRCLRDLGNVARALGNPEEAVDLYCDALAGCRVMGYDHLEARVLADLGQGMSALGDLPTSRALVERSVAVALSTNDRRLAGHNLRWLASILHGEGRYNEALGLYRQALDSFGLSDDPRGVSYVLSNLGNTLRELGRLEESVASYEKAALLLRRYGERRWEGFTICGQAETYLQLGDLSRSDDLYRQAELIFKACGDRRWSAYTLGKRGVCAREQGAYEEAASLLILARDQLHELGETVWETQVLVEFGEAQRLLGNFAQARENLAAAEVEADLLGMEKWRKLAARRRILAEEFSP
ncbi:tetratricopeptide repeat protein [Frankia sp. R43]|uniref:tetratricopeptide repeat protein n=1 Tax=Frankia sp. R43 TaxID=269536 RepID=UPI0009FA2833|nr:tetratricopeptide repeat protein [Frankia sp. R43]